MEQTVFSPLVDVIVKWPSVSRALRDRLLVVLGPIAIAAAAHVEVPLKPIPITGQTLAVLVIGATYGWRRALWSSALYIAAGAAGFPFFAGGASGPTHLFGPGGGYLIGFVAAAGLMGWLSERKAADRRFGSGWLMYFVGHTVIFLFGLAWLSHFIGWREAFIVGYLPFVPGELIKTTLAAALSARLWSRITPTASD